jgi:hypothetical protein
MVLPDNGLFGAIAVLGRKRRKDFALNRYAVGKRPADREVTRVRDYEIRFLNTAFPMSALPLIATTERTCQHVSNVPIRDIDQVVGVSRLVSKPEW